MVVWWQRGRKREMKMIDGASISIFRRSNASRRLLTLSTFSGKKNATQFNSKQSAGEDALDLDARRSGARLYLHLKSRKVAVEAEEEQGDEKEEKRPSKLAIGVEGGFSPEGPDTRAETDAALLVYPQRVSIALPNSPHSPSNVPTKINMPRSIN